MAYAGHLRHGLFTNKNIWADVSVAFSQRTKIFPSGRPNAIVALTACVQSWAYAEKRLKTLADAGCIPYPHSFKTSLSIPKFINIHGKEHDEEVLETVAGRVLSKRGKFFDLYVDGTKLQVYLESKIEKMLAVYTFLKRGDIVGVTGHPGMVKELTGGYKITYHSNGLAKDPTVIDFTPPFRRIDMIEELEKLANVKIPQPFSSPDARECLEDLCTMWYPT